MNQTCLLCSKKIDGDEVYFQFHLNQCLDSQIVNSNNEDHDGIIVNESDDEGGGKKKRKESPLILEEEMEQEQGQGGGDEDVALALSLQFLDQQQLEAEAESAEVEDECIICHTSWSHLGTTNLEERNSHMLSCLGSSTPSNSKGKSTERVVPEDDYTLGCPTCSLPWSSLDLVPLSSKGGSEEDWNLRLEHIESCLPPSPPFRSSPEPSTSDAIILGNSGKPIKGTPGLIALFRSLLSSSSPSPNSSLKKIYFCSPSVQHISTQFQDLGWGCGYRNGMMIFSSAREMNCYSTALGGGRAIVKEEGGRKGKGLANIPSIGEWQEVIEMAWRCGYDKDGAAHFKNKLVGKKKWIGTTEIYTALVWLGIRTKIVDFPAGKSIGKGNDTHQVLIKWILNYFSSPSENELEPPIMTSSSIIMTTKQPLYLQHQGHSRTIIGIEQSKNGENWLLIFDPSKYPKQSLKDAAAALLLSSSSVPSNPSKKLKLSPPPPPAATDVSSFWAQQPGASTSSSSSNSNSTTKTGWEKFGHKFNSGGTTRAEELLLKDNGKKVMEPFRLSLSSLKKNCEYQILYVEEGSMYTKEEKEARKIVLSTVITGS